jgi:hypothetical protein
MAKGMVPIAEDPRFEKNPGATSGRTYTTSSGRQATVNPYRRVDTEDYRGPAMGSRQISGGSARGVGVPYLPPSIPGGGGGGRGGRGGGGGRGTPKFETESPAYMKEVMDMYRDLMARNQELSGEFDVEDLLGKQRAEHSIQQKEAEAAGERTGGLSAAERRNMAMDQSRSMAETRGGAERGKLDFEAGLLRDLGGAISGAGTLAGTEGDFLNRARSNEQDLFKYLKDYPLRQAEIAASIRNSEMGALAQLAALA